MSTRPRELEATTVRITCWTTGRFRVHPPVTLLPCWRRPSTGRCVAYARPNWLPERGPAGAGPRLGQAVAGVRAVGADVPRPGRFVLFAHGQARPGWSVSGNQAERAG
jgi:hypothetical protein